ncbi:uncharacterized protein LOC122669021 [Telopea speciosissima]|uniref:uncharacterized protein LOC122669021 n=1 Tax=Telopea speciosissima TaxID=54955 RepID=UPI001CC72A7C|nr:uncharacterized protein LOC122669021 [Telopea speciosissima]
MTVSSSRTKSSGPVSHGFQRSVSPSGRFYSSSTASSSSTGFAYSSSSFSSGSTGFFHRSASPTRVNLYGSVSSSPSVRFSIDRSISPSRSIAASTRDQVVKKHSNPMSSPSCPRRTCMCSPTTHPGSFRCSLHKGFNSHHHHPSGSYPSNRLNARRSAMTNSLVRIGTVEGEWVKRALAALIRPSSHHQRRRAAFHPRPSRLSNMSKVQDL